MRKRIFPFHWLWLLLLGAMCPACNNPTVVADSDFENLDGWLSGPNTAWVTRDQAHSGRHSAAASSAMPYAANYNNSLDALGNPRKLRVNAWAMLPNGVTRASIVVQVVRPTRKGNLFWEEMLLHQSVRRYGQWVAVRKEFTLPDSLQPTDRLKVYLWSPAQKLNTFVDDVVIEKMR